MLSWAELLLAGLAAALTLILFTLARTERVAVEETQVLDFPEAGVSGRRRRRRRAGRAGSCSTGRRGGSCSTSSRRRVSKDRPEQGGELRARNTSLVRVNTRLVEQHRLQQERLEVNHFNFRSEFLSYCQMGIQVVSPKPPFRKNMILIDCFRSNCKKVFISSS